MSVDRLTTEEVLTPNQRLSGSISCAPGKVAVGGGASRDAFTEPDDRVTLLESWPNDDGGWSVTVTFNRTGFDMRYRIYAVCMDAPPVS